MAAHRGILVTLLSVVICFLLSFLVGIVAGLIALPVKDTESSEAPSAERSKVANKPDLSKAVMKAGAAFVASMMLLLTVLQHFGM